MSCGRREWAVAMMVLAFAPACSGGAGEATPSAPEGAAGEVADGDGAGTGASEGAPPAADGGATSELPPLPPKGWPAPCGAGEEGTTTDVSFTGPVTKKTVSFRVYLPPSYECSGLRYPVTYFLHGLGGGPSTVKPLVASLEAEMKKGTTGPFIVVAADGYGDSMWADSADGTQPAETDVIRQVIPYVDATFRTVPDARRRVVQGFSMGGFGAMLYAAKFPDTFSAAVSFDGALHTWATLLANREEIATKVFGSEAAFDAYSPYAQASVAAAALKSPSRYLRVHVGDLVDYNTSFHDHLTGLGVPHDYFPSPCGHNLQCILNTPVGAATWGVLYGKME